MTWEPVNRTPIVGLKKFRFDDRRCGSFVCVRIEGDVTTTGSGARRWNPSRPEPAGTRSPGGLPYRCIPRETGSGCTGPAARRRSWEATAADATTGRRRSQPRATTSRTAWPRRRSWRSTRSRASRRWNAGAASTGREARRRSGRGPRAGPEARNPNRSPNPRASRSSPNRSPT